MYVYGSCTAHTHVTPVASLIRQLRYERKQAAVHHLQLVGLVSAFYVSFERLLTVVHTWFTHAYALGNKQ
jgi:hypothetical protein